MPRPARGGGESESQNNGRLRLFLGAAAEQVTAEQPTGLDVPLNNRSRVLTALMFAAAGVRNSAALPPAFGASELSHFTGTSNTGFVVVAVLPLPPSPLVPARDAVHTARSCSTHTKRLYTCRSGTRSELRFASVA